MNRTITSNTPYQKLNEACKTTGLSVYFLRNGCKNGTVPHIKSGGVYYVYVPGLLASMEGGKNA